MKKLLKIITSMLCAALIAVPIFVTACDSDKNSSKGELVDYVSQLTLDLNSNTKKQEVEVRLYVDGDTTHFNPITSTLPGCNNAADFSVPTAPTKGYAKARYLAINTPESTGQIEEWGKKASNFTHEKLASATSIIIESDDDKWNIDSTGGRYLLWVWYKPEGATEYRNLNIEILQAGLAFGSSIDSLGHYGDVAKAALTQAQEAKLYVFSGEKDPDYYYGGPINIDLRELRFNTEAYVGKKIVVEGLVVADFNNSSYIEQYYDDIEGYENGIRIGMPVFHFPNPGTKTLEILSVGNYVSVVGVVVFYETGGYYQITDIKAYNRYNPDDPNNCKLIEKKGLDNAYAEIDPYDFASDIESVRVEVEKKNDEGEDYTALVDKTYREAILGTSVSVSNLTVYRVTTTVNEESSSYGAMTLYCTAEDGTEISVRTDVFYDDEGELLTKADYEGKKISVKGIVEYYSTADSYQIKCHRSDYLTVLD